MKTIAYFVTDSGFGHMTRSVALINKILDFSDYNVIVISNREQISYAKIGLRRHEKRVSFANIDTDANTVLKPHSLDVDIKATEKQVEEFYRDMDMYLDEHYYLLKGMEIVGVITDISILGIMVAEKLGVKAIGISNYTWYNRFKKYGLKKEILDFYLKWYNKLDLLIKLQFSDNMDDITCKSEEVGLICREINEMNSKDFKKTYWPAVYLSVGQVEKKKEKFNIDFPLGTIVATGSIELEGNGYLVKLPPRVSSTHDYIAASSFALIKGGWSSVAECLVLGVPFGILEQGDTEDAELVEKLFDRNLAFRTTEEQVRNFSIKEMNIKAHSINKEEFKNDTVDIAKLLLSEIEK